MQEFFQNLFQKLSSQKLFPLLMTSGFILFSLISISFLSKAELFTIEQEGIVMREAPATNSTIVTPLEMGTTLQVVDENQGWLNVRLNGNVEGYIPKWLIENPDIQSDQNLAAKLLVATPLYSDANTDSTELTSINAGDYAYVNFESKSWLQVSYQNHYGYIPTSSVSLIHQDKIPKEVQDQFSIEQEEYQAQQEYEKAKNTIYVRQTNQGLITQPNLMADLIYQPSYNQVFKLIDVVNDEYDQEYYFVEDEDGIRGYLESRIAARASDYIGHSGVTHPGSIENAVIVIDPGHGGEDSGAVSSDSQIYEKNITFNTAQYLKSELEQLGANVHLTRNDDVWTELADRVQLSNDIEADAFISLHYDASTDPDWHGTTSYYFHEDDYDIANSINDEIAKLPLPNNHVIFGNYHVIRENDRPSILLELGYMSNPEDFSYIQSDEYHRQIAQAITNGLVNYYNP